MFDEQIFTFGKYKGQTVRSVIDTDPDYVLWCHKNVNHFSISDDLVELCEEFEPPTPDAGDGYDYWN